MIADLIVIGVFALCIFLGYRKGLIKVGVRIISFFAAMIIALVLYTPISNYIIENTEIVPSLKNTIQEAIYGKDDVEEKESSEEASGIAETMEKFVLDYTDEIKESGAEFVSQELAVFVVRIGTWVGLFIVSKIGFLIVRVFADAIAELPVIKQFNKARWSYLWSFGEFCDYLCGACGF